MGGVQRWPMRAFVGGGLLALAAAFGAGVLPAPRFSDWWAPPLQVRKSGIAPESLPGVDEFAFRPLRATRFALGDDEGEIGFLQVTYAEADGTERVALLHPPAPDAGEGGETRWKWWMQTAAAIRKHTQPSDQIIAWWDNGQRIRLLTGRPVWFTGPDESVFPPQERPFWREIAGGFASRSEASNRLARALTAPVDEAIASLRAALPKDGSSALLIVSTDDLARAAEFEAAGGRRLPIESRVFTMSTNLHGTIGSVRRWASAAGPGSYLVQPLPGQRVRAWRLTDAAALDWLLVRALPFSTSLYRPIDGADLVYQSAGGGYLSVYRLRGNDAAHAEPLNRRDAAR